MNRLFRKAPAGGYLGKFSPSEIDPRIARALTGHKAFSDPVTVETESGFHIVQQIAPLNIDEWKRLLPDAARRKKKQKTAIEDTKPQPSLSVNAAKGGGQNPPPPFIAAEGIARHGFQYFIQKVN